MVLLERSQYLHPPSCISARSEILLQAAPVLKAAVRPPHLELSSPARPTAVPVHPTAAPVHPTAVPAALSDGSCGGLGSRN